MSKASEAKAEKNRDEAAKVEQDAARSEQKPIEATIPDNLEPREPSKEEMLRKHLENLGEHIKGLDKSAAMKYLLVVEDMTFAKAEKFWNAFGANAKKNTREMINDYLAVEPRTERDFYTYIIDNGTKNDARWISQLNNTRKLTIEIFKRFLDNDDPMLVEVNATDNQKQLVKDILK